MQQLWTTLYRCMCKCCVGDLQLLRSAWHTSTMNAECKSTREADMEQRLDKGIAACPPSNDENMMKQVLLHTPVAVKQIPMMSELPICCYLLQKVLVGCQF